MKLINIFVMIVASLGLVACSGGSGSNGYTHSQLATDFVEALNYDLNYDIELIKHSTRQFNYIVVYDYDLETYDAYDLSGYDVGDNIDWYLDDYENSFYYDLEYGGGNLYEAYDRFTDSYIQFSKSTMTSADTVKGQELVDNLKMKKASKQLKVQFGLNPKRAKEVAGLALQLSGADRANMTTYQYDQYSKAILGSSFTEVQAAMADKLSGNDQTLEAVYEKAAKANGVTKANVKRLANLFIKN